MQNSIDPKKVQWDSEPINIGSVQWDDVPMPAKGAESGFWSNISKDLSKRGGNLSKIWQGGSNESVLDSFGKSALRAYSTAGQGAGLVNDVIGEALKSGYKALVPEGAQQDIAAAGRGFAESPAGQLVGKGVKAASDQYAKLKEAYPEFAMGLEATGNIAGAYPVLRSTPLRSLDALKEAGSAIKKGAVTAKGAVTPTPKNLASIDKKIDDAIVYGFKKGIKPSVAGKSDAMLTQKYYDSAKQAVRDVMYNAETPISTSPNALEAFSNGVRNTKIDIWDRATAMTQQAGQRGVTVSYDPILSDMASIADDAVNRIGSKGMVNAANDIYETISAELASGGLNNTPQTMERLIASMNNKARSFWRDPNMHETAAVYERAAQVMRKELFDKMGELGDSVKELRKAYGSQLAIEKDVAHRANIYARRNEFGFFDLANIPAVTAFVDGVSGLATGNVSGLAKSAAILTAKQAMKNANDAEKVIRKMFGNVETFEAMKGRYMPKDLVPTFTPRPTGYRPNFTRTDIPNERGFIMTDRYGNEIFQPTAKMPTPDTIGSPEGQGVPLLTSNPILAESQTMRTGLPPGKDVPQIPWQDFEVVGSSPRGMSLVPRQPTINMPRNVEASNAMDAAIRSSEALKSQGYSGPPPVLQGMMGNAVIPAFENQQKAVQELFSRAKDVLPTWDVERLRSIAQKSPIKWDAKDKILIIDTIRKLQGFR